MGRDCYVVSFKNGKPFGSQLLDRWRVFSSEFKWGCEIVTLHDAMDKMRKLSRDTDYATNWINVAIRVMESEHMLGANGFAIIEEEGYGYVIQHSGDLSKNEETGFRRFVIEEQA